MVRGVSGADRVLNPLLSDEVEDVEIRLMPAPADAVTVVAHEPSGWSGAETLRLRLEDLLPDQGGEVVLTMLDGPPVCLLSNDALVDSGLMEAHVTASGVNVDGFGFYAFHNGVILYVPSDLDISVTSPSFVV